MDHLFGPDGDTVVKALRSVALLLFVAAGAPLLARRRRLRRAAVIVYLSVLALVLVAIAVWLVAGAGSRPAAMR